jgi:hypothetical protein
MFQPPRSSPRPASTVTVDQAARALAQAQDELAKVRQMGAVARAAYRAALAGSDPYITTLARDRIDGAEILISRAHAAVGAAERVLREAQDRECGLSPAAPQAPAGGHPGGCCRGR